MGIECSGLKITVITVCYNSAAHIADALRSVDSQTWKDTEHIIVDGASADDTMKIVRSHPQPWRRAISEVDKGIYDAMNKGILMAEGEVIGFINSDDFYSSPHVLARVADAFTDPSVDACYGDLCYVERDNIETVVRYWHSSGFSPGLFLRGWCPPHPTFFVRKSVYERLNTFDLQYRIAADVELMARFMEVHRIETRYIPEVLVTMRLGGTTNRSWSNVVKQNREIFRALKAHGLRPSLASFGLGKVLSRSKQFLARPK
jgi:glycosyltransferase involved in cell wall biosynthesis